MPHFTATSRIHSSQRSFSSLAKGVFLGAVLSSVPLYALADSPNLQGAEKPHIVIVGTGGTIAGAGKLATDTSTYKTASVGIDKILEQVPDAARFANVTSEQLFQVGSKSMTEEYMIKLAKRVEKLLEDPSVDGVVVTHGTDTLEETAYFLNLTVHSSKPIVFAASMRPSTAISADGPLNLLDAVVIAASPQSQNKGVLVSLNDEIHSARDVSKTSSFKTDTFKSPYGPLGYVVEGRPFFYRDVIRANTVNSQFDIRKIEKLPRVDITYQYTNSDMTAFNAFVKAGARGIVIAGTGNGNVSDQLLPELANLGDKTLLVRSSRTGSGSLYRGASYDADKRYGFVAVDDQTPVKARLLTALALTQTSDPVEVREIMYKY
ncbi:asparaginase [Pseudomonas alvandae]|uniref:asparaginase n=1 Tax=Pseudomonas canavaninivorans TaxID=2842348 RepID=UPI003D6493C4